MLGRLGIGTWYLATKIMLGKTCKHYWEKSCANRKTQEKQLLGNKCWEEILWNQYWENTKEKTVGKHMLGKTKEENTRGQHYWETTIWKKNIRKKYREQKYCMWPKIGQTIRKQILGKTTGKTHRETSIWKQILEKKTCRENKWGQNIVNKYWKKLLGKQM